jgi:hypothetical protein
MGEAFVSASVGVELASVCEVLDCGCAMDSSRRESSRWGFRMREHGQVWLQQRRQVR